jgi:hypothetical protein
MMIIPWLQYIRSMPLKHGGDCHFAGISQEPLIYVDEFYGEDDSMARYAFRLDGTLVASSDEDTGDGGNWLALPPNLTKPSNVRPDHPLQFSGARLRGMQDEDRIQDLVQPLSIAEKIALSKILNIPSPWLIGLAESIVLAEARLARPGPYDLPPTQACLPPAE